MLIIFKRPVCPELSEPAVTSHQCRRGEMTDVTRSHLISIKGEESHLNILGPGTSRNKDEVITLASDLPAWTHQ